MRYLGLALVLLTACAGDGAGWGGLPVFDETNADGLPTCDGQPGEARVELCDDSADNAPLADGAVFSIARRPQGEITIFTPVWFGGLRGGGVLDELTITFVDDAGEVLGRRNNQRWALPCDEQGQVVADWPEVFFDPFAQPEDYDGVHGTLEVVAVSEGGDHLEDSIQAVLSAD